MSVAKSETLLQKRADLEVREDESFFEVFAMPNRSFRLTDRREYQMFKAKQERDLGP